MTGFEIAALAWLADFVKGLATTLLGERLKPKSSAKEAKDRAQDLYSSLKELRSDSEGFVTALAALTDGQSEAQDALIYEMERVSDSLSRLVSAVHNVDPQLSIYAPEPAEDIERARSCTT